MVELNSGYNVDYDALYAISEELATVVAMATNTGWNQLSRDAYQKADVLQWAILDTAGEYANDLRTVVAAGLYLLMRIEREKNE